MTEGSTAAQRSYYLDTYRLAPDEEFLEHIRAAGYRAPEADGAALHRALAARPDDGQRTVPPHRWDTAREAIRHPPAIPCHRWFARPLPARARNRRLTARKRDRRNAGSPSGSDV